MSAPDIDDPEVVAREYATLERLRMRRLDRTGWLRSLDEPIHVALRAIAEVRPRRVLEVGCGAGDFAALLCAPDVRCVDLSPAAVEAARSRGLAAEVGDAQALRFETGSVDVVVSNWTLYHVPDRARAIAEVARVLTPNGRFVGCYNAPDHMAELWSRLPVRRAADQFDAATGPGELARVFASVDVRPTENEVLWVDRRSLQMYLDAYVELYGPLSAPTGPYPFRAVRRNVVFVADKRSPAPRHRS